MVLVLLAVLVPFLVLVLLLYYYLSGLRPVRRGAVGSFCNTGRLQSRIDPFKS